MLHIDITNSINKLMIETSDEVTKCDCIVHSTFLGQLRYDMECEKCSFVSSSYEMTMAISLDIPKLDSI